MALVACILLEEMKKKKQKVAGEGIIGGDGH